MNKRLWLWGLSNGATMFALAGAFWTGLGVATAAAIAHWLVPAVGTIVQVVGTVGLVWAAARLRRRSGFRRSELRKGDAAMRAQTRRVQIWMLWTVAGQALLIALAVWICVRLKSEPMIWPSIGVVVSLHLVPLARLFHVRAYYATAIAGTLVGVGGFAIAGTPDGLAWLCLAMAAVTWLSATYLLIHADRIAEQAQREIGAV